jgi:hypothetical protein
MTLPDSYTRIEEILHGPGPVQLLPPQKAFGDNASKNQIKLFKILIDTPSSAEQTCDSVGLSFCSKCWVSKLVSRPGEGELQ